MKMAINVPHNKSDSPKCLSVLGPGLHRFAEALRAIRPILVNQGLGVVHSQLSKPSNQGRGEIQLQVARCRQRMSTITMQLEDNTLQDRQLNQVGPNPQREVRIQLLG